MDTLRNAVTEKDLLAATEDTYNYLYSLLARSNEKEVNQFERTKIQKVMDDLKSLKKIEQ